MKEKLEIVKLLVDIGTGVHAALVEHRDEGARRREERRKAQDDEKDRQIRELERDVERLREKS